MTLTTAEEIGTSRIRLAIADLLSVRPRPLGELAEMTGISVQGVLKHLKKIARTGTLEETELRGNRFLGIRKVYSLRSASVGNYSRDELMIAHFSEKTSSRDKGGVGELQELESIAEEIILQRRRIESMAKRMERLIVELESSQERLEQAIHMHGMNRELELIALALFTEPSVQEAREVLSKHYACSRPAEAIAAALESLRSG